MKYKFKFKRNLLWKSYTVLGHRYDSDQGKMVLYFEDGGVLEIARWKDCSIKLGQDWVLAMKKNLEEKAGTTVPVTMVK